MVTLHDAGVYLVNGSELVDEQCAGRVKELMGGEPIRARAAAGTIAHRILAAHDTGDGAGGIVRVKFDAMASHDITYVGIIQTARASGMERFPLPYVLTCCHNSLCAVGGTINDDDHLFGLSAAVKYGGIYVPPHIAVIHQFMRENFAAPGKMVLGSDSHTRYGALGTMAVGEGGGELDKQLLGDTWDVERPEVVAVYLTGAPQPWVGPMDVALSIIGAVYECGYVKNKVMEFVGPGVGALSVDYRNGIDVMTTETTCLSSVWRTDEQTRAWLEVHGRGEEFEQLDPADLAYYDGCVEVDLSTVKPMVAMPFHPSNAYEIDALYDDLDDILHETEVRAAEVAEGRAGFTLRDKVGGDGRLQVQQGVIAGCAGGTWSNVVAAAGALKGKSCGAGEFYLSVYPASQPVLADLDRRGCLAELMDAGAIVRTAFCGPCFGAGDTPANNALSVRHATRNFPNREGSKPGDGQMAAVALMDARSIAATAAAHGKLTSAEEMAGAFEGLPEDYRFDDSSYRARVYRGFGDARPAHELRYGPNIKDWPEQAPLGEHVLLRLCAKIEDAVTTTDELIPSGETSSYRSNPLGLAEFTLSRRDPGYVARAKEARGLEEARRAGQLPEKLRCVLTALRGIEGFSGLEADEVEVGSTIYARKPGDGSAREQAASCQRVLGGLANIVSEFATKRYRSNCMNWGMLPLHYAGEPDLLEVGAWVFVPGIRRALEENAISSLEAWVVDSSGDGGAAAPVRIELSIAPMTAEEREIVMAGCLINYNRAKQR